MANAQGSWTPLPVTPTARWLVSATTGNDGKIYAIGGSPGELPTAVVEAYDPNTMTWTSKAPLPTLRTPQTALGPDGRIYAFGGWRGGSEFSNVVEAYDPFDNTWSRATSMLVPREAPGAALGLDGRIYAIGGLRTDYSPLYGRWLNKIMNSAEVFIPD